MNPASNGNSRMAGAITSGLDVFTKDTLLALGVFFLVLVFWWLYRVITLVNVFLKASEEVLENGSLTKNRVAPFYQKEELRGTYKGRDVIVGVLYSGFKGEFLPLPYIQMRLKEAVGYNTNRLPHYAEIQKNFLIYKIKLSALWGVFDKSYPPVFSKNHLIIALERLVATAEDVERGRTLKELFK